MLGIRAGQGARDERGGRSDRGPRPDRPERGGRRGGPDRERREPRPEGAGPSAPQEAATTEKSSERPRDHGRQERGDRGGRGNKKGGGEKGGERKPRGPLVVVKRASGVIETRPLDAAAPEPRPSGQADGAAAPQAAVEAASSAPAQAPAAVVEAPAPAPAPRAEPVVSSALYEEVPESQTFAEMYEASARQEGGAGRRQVRVGEKVTGTIFQLGADTAFVTLAGGKSEAMIDLRELKDDQGILRYGVGDAIDAHVVEAGAKGIILSKALAKGAASMALLAEAKVSTLPVEGLVLSVNKGGLEVAVGDVRAFCPISQVDLRFVEKPDQFIGERLKFRVTEVRDRKVVLSRRALLEEEQRAIAAETRKHLAVGAVLKGKISGVRDFGAFVDLGGVEGMIPVSELSHLRVGHPSEVVKVGDEVEVEVLKLDPPNPSSPDKAKQKERISLSMRSRQEDPWKAALEEIKEGSRLKGKVVRLQPFGAFVELRPGIDGLIHISALSERRISHPRDVVQVGQEVEVTVEKVDPGERRIGLRLVTEEAAARSSSPPGEGAPGQAAEKPAPKQEIPRPKVGQVVTGKIDRIEPYGVFLAFPGGKGLVPASETGTERGTDLRRAFQLGQELKASVLEIDASGKIRLSLTAAARAEERADMETWMKTQPKGGGGKGFGTFADLLKGRKL